MKKNSILLIISSIIIIYAIIGFVAVPKIAKPQIEQALNENLTQKASIGKVEFNPFLLKFSVYDFKIFDEKETTVSSEKLLIDFSIIKSIDERHISFKDLQLIKPYVNIIEYEDGTLNLQKLAKEKKEQEKVDEPEESSDIKFQIYRTILDNARVKFTKLSANNEPFEIDVNKLNYTFYDIGTYRNTLASHSLKILINNHSELKINGGVRLSPFKMHGNVELNNFKPTDFLAYKKDILNFELQEESHIDLKFGYKVDTTKKLKISVDNLEFDLKNLDIKQNDNSILSLKHLVVEELNLKYPENSVDINTIRINKLKTKVIIDKNETLNFTTLIKEEKNEEDVSSENTLKTEEKQEIDINNVEVTEVANNEESKLQETQTTQENPWKVNLKKLNLVDSNVNFQDLKNLLLVDIKNINLDMSTFKLNGKDFTLEKASLSKTNIDIKEKKSKLDIQNNDLNIVVNNVSMLNDILNIKDINLDILNTQFNDIKNKLQLFTKKSSLKIENLGKTTEEITIDSVTLSNPSILLNDKKNSLKVLTNNLSLALNNTAVKGNDIELKNLSLKTPVVKFNDLKSKMDITTKNINLDIKDTTLINEKLKVSLLSLARPTVYLFDKKNNTTVVASKLNLKLKGIENYKDLTKVSSFSLYEPNVTIKDKINKTDIVAKNINLYIRKISNGKNGLKVVSSSINKPYVSITLGKKETKETDEEEKKIEKVAKKTKKKKSDFKFDIGPVKIKNMKMTFEDKNLPIPFKTDITELNGNFSRLHSSSSRPTKLQLEGKVDKYGYTKITGTVDINDIKILTDTNLLFKNIAVKNFTPYSGKFVGREIDSGKLDLDLKYNIKKSDLKAQNSVIISDIKLGKNVDSPDAANLPLELAIALLEDSNGVIDIDLPISGNVDDPQFSVAPIVWKVFTNLIIKAISAPFSLLASVFGFDEESIKSLDFEYGKSDILASEKESLDNISKILSKKPKLAINIKPVYNPIKDKMALQDIKFEAFLLKEMEEIPEGDDYKEALEDLYEDIDDVKDLDDVEESFTKKDKNGDEIFDNDSYVEYLRRFLAAREKVSDDELINLAKLRVKNINDYLLNEKKVPVDSVKILELEKQIKKDLKWVVFDLDVSTK